VIYDLQQWEQIAWPVRQRGSGQSFDEPLKRLAAHFGKQAVLLTGATPAISGRNSWIDFNQTRVCAFSWPISKPAVLA
jgi:hypothetical protein